MARLTVFSHFRQRGFFDRPPIPGSRPRRTLAAKEAELDAILREAKALLHEVEGFHPPPVCDVLGLIHRNLTDPGLTADRVSQSFPGSRLRVGFLKATGKTFRAYIEDARLLVAARLLLETDVEMYLVSDAVGYDYYETFFRAFKRHLGCSPSEFRAHNPERTSQAQPDASGFFVMRDRHR